MSYTSTEWNDNDEVTSAKLNHLESGVTAVGYEPTTWQAGDVVTAEKLNHLEQGVADSADVLASLVRRDIKEFTFTSDMGNAVEIGNACPLSFYGCTLLERINGLDMVKKIHSYGFAGTQKLTGTLTFQNVESVGDVSNGAPAFAGSGVNALSFPLAEWFNELCLGNAPNLKTVYAPKIKYIYNNTLLSMSNPVHVYIGSSVVSIGAGAFYDLPSGSVIDCGFAEGAVSGAPWGAASATINYSVPDPGSIDAMIEGESDN